MFKKVFFNFIFVRFGIMRCNSDNLFDIYLSNLQNLKNVNCFSDIMIMRVYFFQDMKL